MEEILTLEDWRIAGEDIDQLETAITKLSQYPVATQALLAALEERHNAREVALQKIINEEQKNLA